MSQDLNSKRMLCISSGLAGVIGVVLLGLSFAINAGPPPNATGVELMKFATTSTRTFFGEHGCKQWGRF